MKLSKKKLVANTLYIFVMSIQHYANRKYLNKYKISVLRYIILSFFTLLSNVTYGIYYSGYAKQHRCAQNIK